MDDETKTAIQQLSQRLDQAEKTIATHSTVLVNHVLLVQKLMAEMADDISSGLKFNDRLKTMEKSFPVLEKRFSDMEYLLNPQLPTEITISEAIQRLVNTVGNMAAEMVLLKRRMREEPSEVTSDDEVLISPVIN